MHVGPSHVFLFLSCTLTLSLFIYTLSRKHTLLNVSFGFFALACAFYALGYGFELLSIDLESMLFWSRVQYIGIPFISSLFMIFSICYIGKENLLKKPVVFLIFIIPVISLIARWTNHFHSLFYLNPSVFYSDNGVFLSFDAGPLYFLHILYSIVTLLISTILFVRFLSRTFSVYRKQTILIFSALAVQWAALLVYLSGFGPDYYDINPFLFSISTLFYAVGIYRYSLFSIVPVARAKVFDEMNDAVLVVDPEQRLVDFNKRCFALFDNIHKHNIGKDIRILFTEYPEIINMITNPQKSGIEFSWKGGIEPQCFRLSLKELEGRKARMAGSILTFHDITDQKRFIAELENLAAIDLLTGIYNRRQLLIQAEIEIKRTLRTKKPLSLLIIDLDHFKAVNDNHGHHGGDVVLRAFSEMVQRNIREIDVFGRYGGEEFIIVMPETARETACEIAERLRVKTEEMTIIFNDKIIKITISIGLSFSRDYEAVTFDKLVQDADRALYTVKENGRNKIFFGSET